jgi:hypothetical protein
VLAGVTKMSTQPGHAEFQTRQQEGSVLAFPVWAFEDTLLMRGRRADASTPPLRPPEFDRHDPRLPCYWRQTRLGVGAILGVPEAAFR